MVRVEARQDLFLLGQGSVHDGPLRPVFGGRGRVDLLRKVGQRDEARVFDGQSVANEGVVPGLQAAVAVDRVPTATRVTEALLADCTDGSREVRSRHTAKTTIMFAHY